MSKFKDSVIVLDDMGDKLNKNEASYFTDGRHHNIQMIVMCHKPAQIINTARKNCDTIHITNYNGADLFSNFDEIYNSKHDFHEIIKDLNINHYNITDDLEFFMVELNIKRKRILLLLLIVKEL